MDTRIAIFPGSFDPFTLGHKSIVDHALPLFDSLVIAIGINRQKQRMMPVDECIRRIEQLYANEPKVSVVSYDTLTIDMAAQYNARYIVRGVRNTADFEYERNIADINRRLSGIDTLFFIADPDTAYISSSLVRELASFGKPIDHLLP